MTLFIIHLVVGAASTIQLLIYPFQSTSTTIHCKTMGPKRRSNNRGGKKIADVGNIAYHLRTLDDWMSISKSGLLVESKRLNLDTKNKNKKDLAYALMESYKLQFEINNPSKKIVNYSSDDGTSTSQSSSSESSSVEFNANLLGLGGPQTRRGVDSDNTVSYKEVGDQWQHRDDRQVSVAGSEDEEDDNVVETQPARKRRRKSKSSAIDIDKLTKNISSIVEETVNSKFKAFVKRKNKPALRSSSTRSTRMPPSCSSVGGIPEGFSAPGSLFQNTEQGAAADTILNANRSTHLDGHSFSQPRVSPTSSSTTLPPILPPILKKIKASEYINFDYLLPPSINVSSTTTVTSIPMSDGEYNLVGLTNHEGRQTLSLGQKTPKSRVKDFPTWCLAWSNYLRCMMNFFPHLASQMVTYQAFIIQFANQYAFPAVYAYDQLHRVEIANDPTKSWDVIDDMLFNQTLRGAPAPTSTVMDKAYASSSATVTSGNKYSGNRSGVQCFNCGRKGHTAPQCFQSARFVQQQGQSAGSGGGGQQFRNATQPNPTRSQSTARAPPKYCFRYNKGALCQMGCIFLHKCDSCNGDHPFYLCPQRPPHSGSK